MTTSTQWQLARESAERYQHILTPAILGPFAEALVDHAALQRNERVVDVGCGTGAAARHAAATVGSTGQVIGIDVNASMIDVARSLPAVPGAAIDWQVANATQLPLDDGSVDVVLCAQTLQFLPDKQASLSEMQRVTDRDGRIVLSLWYPIEDNPYFHTLVSTIARHIGLETAVGLQSAFSLSDADEIYQLLQEADLAQIEMTVVQLDLPLPHLAEFVPRHISATPMAAGFDQAATAVQQTIIREVVMSLSRYGDNGRIQIPFRAHVIMCRHT